MSWTDERIESLKSMWAVGYTASDIANLFDNISRNAVIGKAHRLGLESRPKPPSEAPPLPPAELFLHISELSLRNRVLNAILNSGAVTLGDLVQNSELELLRLPDFGRKSLNEVKDALERRSLRLGMWIPDWPQSDLKKTSQKYLEAARRASELRQTPGGATFQPNDDHFVMETAGDENDLAVALRRMTGQMQSALLQKVASFAAVAARLDNQPGWAGIAHSANTLHALLNRPPAEIPDVLGYIYPTAIELGSFVELDQQLTAGADSYAIPLDPEVRRPLADLVRNLAPWLRSFPSIREADDEASRFLVQAAELKPTIDVVKAASDYTLLTESDLKVFRQLHEAANRGAFQGEKAAGRAKRSASNLVIGAVALAGTFFVGAVSSDFATTSPLVHKVRQFLVKSEILIESLILDLPQDLRYSIVEFVRDLPENLPVIPSQPPKSEVYERRPSRVRNGKIKKKG